MRKAPLLVTLGVAVWCIVPAVQALGIGRTASASSLGQPLNIVAAVQLDGEETLTSRCIYASIVAGDAPVPADKVRVALEQGNDPHQRRIRITTTSPIAEPLVTVNLTIGCQSRVMRSFVTLINPLIPSQVDPLELDSPPTRSSATTVAVAQPALAAQGGTPMTRFTRHGSERITRMAAPVVAAPAAKQLPASTSIVATPSTPTPTTTPIVSKVATLTPPGVAPQVRPAGKVESGLSTESQVAALTQRVDAALKGRATARNAVKVEPVVVAAAQDDHVRELEAGLAALRDDSARGRQSVAALQARLHEVEDTRSSSPVAYIIGGSALLLAAMAVAMWKLVPWQRAVAGSASTGKTSNRSAKAAAASERAQLPVLRDRAVLAKDDAAALERLIEPVGVPVSEPMDSHRPLPFDDRPGGLEVTAVIDPATLARVKNSSRAAGASSPATFSNLEEADTRGQGPTMEELIDVEQQAEFYLVMGRDDAAIALLDKHIASGGGSPLPFLKLLEIHQRRRDEASYNRVRQHFNERFKAYAPEWTESLELGRSLDDYPGTLETVQTAWAAPIHAMKMLDGLLFRRSANEDAFDFAAYRELLFLYSIARDLSGDVKPAMGADIDLVLPLDEESIALLSRRMKTVLPTVSANASRIGNVGVDVPRSSTPDAGEGSADEGATGVGFARSMTGTR